MYSCISERQQGGEASMIGLDFVCQPLTSFSKRRIFQYGLAVRTVECISLLDENSSFFFPENR